MKRTALILMLLFGTAIVSQSCRSQKQACAAYSKVEQPVTDQSNS